MREAQHLTTAQPTDWHDNLRGHFTVPAGTPLRLVHDMAAAVPDPVERAAFEKTRARDLKVGLDLALVQLEGGVRWLDRRLIQAARQELAA